MNKSPKFLSKVGERTVRLVRRSIEPTTPCCGQLENFGKRESTPEIATVHDAASRLSEPDKHAVTRYLSALK